MPIVSKSDFLNTTFDYLIIGGGTAGLVLAARLSENPDVVVGVLEAGEDRGNTTAVQYPGLAGKNLGNPDFDWMSTSVPQKHANGRVTYQPRGERPRRVFDGKYFSPVHRPVTVLRVDSARSSAPVAPVYLKLHLLGSSRGSKVEYDAFAQFGSEDWITDCP
ncbi:hypothetical protein EVG20_g5785 [Dentipellis fragilis]|uniref:Uncharacterized protein n=1 Tax=Dentipellis fragilis TaxID=205917 RepID=A0A4Y9YTM9_9AGAM|nr:hypothetical protein EVG20_g5785 [Dentipellis fragilis]